MKLFNIYKEWGEEEYAIPIIAKSEIDVTFININGSDVTLIPAEKTNGTWNDKNLRRYDILMKVGFLNITTIANILDVLYHNA